jgi:protein tyrosine/serine phosphatase
MEQDSRSRSLARRTRIFIGVFAIASCVAAALIVEYRLGPKHLSTVEPGVLYRSAALPPEQLEGVIDDYGIRTVVNLRSTLENERGEWHANQTELLERKGVELVNLPMHTGYPPDDGTLEEWLNVMETPEMQPVLVHREYGVVRTGMMVGVYEIEHHSRSNAEVAEALGHPVEMNEPVRARVLDFITGYVPRSTER